MKNKAIFKYNGGLGALICSGCSKIIKVGKDMTEDEKKAMRGEKVLPKQYCDNCNKTIST